MGRSDERHPNAGGISLSELARGGPPPSDDQQDPLAMLRQNANASNAPPPPPLPNAPNNNVHHASNPPPFDPHAQMGQAYGAPMMTPPEQEQRPPQATPLWMDVSQSSQPKTRKGATSAPRSGMTTVFFFVGITFVVGAAGMVGIAMWGPDKIDSKPSHFATDPPPPQILPSLPADPADDPAASSADPDGSAAAAPADSSGGKKKGRGRSGGKKH